MTEFTKNNILQINSRTIQEVRKVHNLDKPGIMDQSIDILQDWIQKQDHFVKKDFCRDYLERVIISTKGSVERAKLRVDKMCTLRTRLPELFSVTDVKESVELHKAFINVCMPKLTENNYRIYILQTKRNITPAIVSEVFKQNIFFGEYIRRNDYADGYIIIFDARENDILELITQINILDLRNALAVLMEGFGLPTKKILVISPSKTIDLFVGILKSVISAKMGQRIEAIKNVEGLYVHVPKELLPQDFGGEQKSLIEMNDQWMKALASKDHKDYVKDMAQARVIEELRPSDGSGNEYHGMPGSFKSLNID